MKVFWNAVRCQPRSKWERMRLAAALSIRTGAPSKRPLSKRWSMLAPMWAVIGVSIYFGINATWTLEMAAGAAEALLGGVQ